MGQERWLQFKTNKKKVSDYLNSLNFPKDESDNKTIIIASNKTKTDCWLSWHGARLEIASQVFDDQSAWCSAISNRLHELFTADRAGTDSTGWWKKGEFPRKPFGLQIEHWKKSKNKTLVKEAEELEKLQKLFIKEAKRLLPR
jgi:hypothetical protein